VRRQGYFVRWTAKSPFWTEHDGERVIGQRLDGHEIVTVSQKNHEVPKNEGCGGAHAGAATGSQQWPSYSFSKEEEAKKTMHASSNNVHRHALGSDCPRAAAGSPTSNGSPGLWRGGARVNLVLLLRGRNAH
jgi:hypothetical protein